MKTWKIILPMLILTPILVPAEIPTGRQPTKNSFYKKNHEYDEKQRTREDFKNKRKIPITVTKYNPEPNQTDSTPFIMASNKTVYVGAIALSKDLEEKYGFKFGDKVFLEKLGTYVFQDRMHERWTKKADIFSFSREEALKFGLVKTNLIIIK